MAIHFTCRECRASCDDESACPQCDSEDIAVVGVVEHDDIADARRLAEIRAYWDKQYAAMDFFAVARDLAATAVDTGTMPLIRMGERQAS